MIPLDTVRGLREILLSSRVTYRGSEIPTLNKMLNDLALEENQRNLEARVRAQPTPPSPPENPPRAPAKVTE